MVQFNGQVGSETDIYATSVPARKPRYGVKKQKNVEITQMTTEVLNVEETALAIPSTPEQESQAIEARKQKLEATVKNIFEKVSPQLGVTGDITLSKEELDAYTKQGITPEIALDLERVGRIINGLRKRNTRDIIYIGTLLTERKEAIEFGAFTWYITEHLGLSVDSARRYMAAAEVPILYPMFVPYLENMGLSALYKLGQSKARIAEAAVSDMLNTIKAGELTLESVDDSIKKAKEEQGISKYNRKAPPLGFTPVDGENAAIWIEKIEASLAAGSKPMIKEGVKREQVFKNPVYREMLKRLYMGISSNPLESELVDMLVAAYVASYSVQISKAKAEGSYVEATGEVKEGTAQG